MKQPNIIIMKKTKERGTIRQLVRKHGIGWKYSGFQVIRWRYGQWLTEAFDTLEEAIEDAKVDTDGQDFVECILKNGIVVWTADVCGKLDAQPGKEYKFKKELAYYKNDS